MLLLIPHPRQVMDKGALPESCSAANSRPFNRSCLPAISAPEGVHTKRITCRIAGLAKSFSEPTVLPVAYSYSKSVADLSRGH